MNKKTDEKAIGIGAVIGVIIGAVMFNSFLEIAGMTLLFAFLGPAVMAALNNISPKITNIFNIKKNGSAILLISFLVIIASWAIYENNIFKTVWSKNIHECNSVRFSRDVQPIYIKVVDNQFSWGTKPDTSFKSTSILTNNKAMISAKYYFKRGTYTQVFTYFYNNGKLIITENNEGAISEQEFYCK
tara:strand:+ start:222 stop:782 length:561 start_codon:yes stop_codon:yes gene_type:complete